MSSKWEKCYLNKLVLLQRGHDLPTSKRGKGNIPVAGSNGIVGFHDISKGLVPGVTIGRSGSIGNTQYFNSEYFPLNTTLYVTNFLGNHPKFIYYFFKRFDFSAFDSGSVQPSLNRNFLYTAIIDKPCLEDQKAIAHILGTLDEKIELNKKNNETLEEIAKALFKSWFIDFDPVRAKSENHSSGLPDKVSNLFPDLFEDSELGKIPENWEYKNIGDIFETILGGTPSRKKSEYWKGNIPWIGSGMVNAFRVTKETEFITELGLAKSSTKLLPKRSTLIAITGATLGQTSINEIEVCTNQSVVAIKPCKKISPEFVFLWVQKNVNYLINSQTGGAQQHINKNNVNEMKILLPSKEIMEIFGNIVKPIFDKISINLFESDTLSTLREEMLPKLVSGELSISDAEKIIEKV